MPVERPSPALDYVRGRVPLYTVTRAAGLLGVNVSTFDTWVNGYERRAPDRKPVYGAPIVTRLSTTGRGPSIPFIGLAEGLVLAAFRRTRVPLPKIRRAVEYLEREIGLTHALANERLYQLGPYLLYDFADRTGDVQYMNLVELHNQQQVFAPVVQKFLSKVSLDDGGWVRQLQLPSYKIAEVVVNPEHAFGDPYFVRSGVPVQDVVTRYSAGDSASLLADDYGIPEDQVQEAVQLAERRAA